MKILITSIEAGSGHIAVRDSIYDHLSQWPDKYKLIKFNSQNQAINSFYRTLINIMQPVHEVFYDWLSGDAFSTVTLESSVDIYLESITMLKKHDPDVVISTHAITSAIFARARNQLKSKAKVISVFPDYGELHSIYSPPNPKYMPDRLWVTSDMAKESAIKDLGIPEAKIDRIGILPAKEIIQNSEKGLSKAEWRKQLLHKLPESTIGSMQEDTYTIALVAGGMWISKLEEVFDTLQDNYTEGWPKIQIMIVCGKDMNFHKKLYQRLQQKKYKIPFMAFGYLDREAISKVFLSSNTVVLGSVGAAVLKEIIFTKCGPALVYNNLGGPEKGNLEFLTKNQLGTYLPNAPELINELQAYIEGKRTKEIETFDKNTTEIKKDHLKYSKEITEILDNLIKK